ncbi:CHC2 zinc finger domain-containing protein [methane-oxidizing endosymbiont of Gigantopelta aegis]|uniref:CHC2 zinc finger domain-containing protein n=1 Tax=methane-oxidizing endosymbiont of Gigantopelta aegis TaxID=2794938 RepID=UPI0018DBE5B9|nr:CHC2 zinc finger domain-containing protein [methane-oxidizing endosymbiont of Gigantopelta aegis]
MRATTKSLNVNYIKNAIHPLDFFKYELPGAKLNGREWNDGELCPFHADNKPGSFFVNVQTGAFKCFACDAAGGDIIAFMMRRYGLGFIEALRALSDEWGV